VEEISEGEAEEYLSYDAVILEKEWKTEISFAAIKKAVMIAKKYFHNKPLPTSAEDLLKESLAEARRVGNATLSEDDVIRAAEKRVNVPIHRAGPAEAESLLNLEEKIHERMWKLRRKRSPLSRERSANTERPVSPGRTDSLILICGTNGCWKNGTRQVSGENPVRLGRNDGPF
jgi:ATP-dependent Clp protease ATP-binding subunit ClpA